MDNELIQRKYYDVLSHRLKEASATIFVRRKYNDDEPLCFRVNDEGTELIICDVGIYKIIEHCDDEGIPFYFEFEFFRQC